MQINFSIINKSALLGYDQNLIFCFIVFTATWFCMDYWELILNEALIQYKSILRIMFCILEAIFLLWNQYRDWKGPTSVFLNSLLQHSSRVAICLDTLSDIKLFFWRSREYSIDCSYIELKYLSEIFTFFVFCHVEH